MGKRGPKPKPTSIKIMEGNPGKRPLPTGEPKPASGAVCCPDWLGDYGRECWGYYAPELKRLGLLTVNDRDTFATFCEAYQDFRQSLETIEAEGEFAETKTGQPTLHPAVRKKQNAVDRMRRLGALFGLSPSDRTSLDVADRQPSDFEQWEQRLA